MEFGREDLAELLESLARRIRAGEMTLGTGDSSLTMALTRPIPGFAVP